MLKSPLIGDLVRKGEVNEIKNVMARSRDLGMQTFDQALYDLFRAGRITEEVALVHADSANDLRMMIKYADAGSEGLVQARKAASQLSLKRDEDF